MLAHGPVNARKRLVSGDFRGRPIDCQDSGLFFEKALFRELVYVCSGAFQFTALGFLFTDAGENTGGNGCHLVTRISVSICSPFFFWGKYYVQNKQA